MRKPRQPTAQEIEQFRRAAGQVRPLADDRAHHAPPQRKARPRPAEAGPAPLYLPDAPEVDPGDRGAPLDFARPGVQRKVFMRLRRGQLPVEDDLDLHGMTVGEAGRALERFLGEASARGRRCVRIVHGKGTGSPTGRATLKSNVDRWLRLHREVLAFASAIPPDGGTGAVTVLLRTARG